MGKGYKRKTRWRTLNIGAPPGEEDEEDGIRNGYTKGQENGTSSRNGQPGHKTGRTDSAGSTTSDYASDYASAASRSRRDNSGGSPSQPKIIFDENEYTRITTPRQDVLFKKGYLSRKKVWASTASTSATPSTTESQSASHSTADGSETTEDQQLLDYKENGAEEYPGIADPSAQVAYSTFYDHTSGYYYEYPVMLVGPGGGIPGPPMHNVLTAVPCGPVPLRPIEWVNPAYVPKLGNQQYCVMDYQTAHLAQYPTLVDENGVPLIAPPENTNGCEETCFENGTGSASWSGSAGDEEQHNGDEQTPQIEAKNGTTETNSVNNAPADGEQETSEAAINSELYLENALAQQLQVTHVAVPPVLQPYMYPGHYMFGPSLVNINGVTIQSGPMVRNTGVTGGPANTGACAKRRKKKKLSKRKSRRPVGPGNGEDEEQEEEEYSSESENHAAALSQLAGTSDQSTTGIVDATDSATSEKPVVTTSSATPRRPLNPECQEFRPTLECRKVVSSVEATSLEATTTTSQSNSDPLSSAESSDNHPLPEANIIDEKPTTPLDTNQQESTDAKATENLSKRPEGELEAAPVEFAAEVFANVTTMAERALASRSVVEGTPIETEIGLDVTSINFQEIVENLVIPSDVSPQGEETRKSIIVSGRRRIDEGVEEDAVPNGQSSAVEKEDSSSEKAISHDGATKIHVETGETISKRPRSTNESQRGSRSASPGMINRTTTPINAKSQRLPESYESLVIRGSSNPSSSASSSAPTGSSGQQQATRNRKYSAKGPKFVREATPGPDLDVMQLQAQIQQTSIEPQESIRMKVLKSESSSNIRESRAIAADGTMRISASFPANIDGEAIEAIEAELQGYSVSTTGSFAYADNKRDANADGSNDDSGVESQRFSTEHPITDAVTEWLHRANSPQLFVTSGRVSESEPEDDELEDAEPPKNLQGNPTPALSANSGDVNDDQSLRFAKFGKFANGIDTMESTGYERNNNNNNSINNNTNNNSDSVDRTKDCVASRRKRRSDGKRRGSKKCSIITKNDSSVASVDQREDKSSRDGQSSDVEKEKIVESARMRVEKIVNDVCELIENDSVADVRVAKSSRTTRTMEGSCASRVDRSRRSNSREKSTVIMLSSREVPVENVEVKVRRMTDENDEGIVEDEEVSVRTFEKGEIVVSIEGKVLPVAAYEPILLKHHEIVDTNDDWNVNDEKPKFRTITCEKSRREEAEETSTVSDDGASKRNSLGSIEEPDVLECWEVETVEPIATPKKTQTRGTAQQGEAAEDDFGQLPEIDSAGVEIVRKYYRLEAMRDSGTSVTSVEDCYSNERDNANGTATKSSISNSPERMIESLCSEEIPVIGERMSNIIEKIFNDSGIPIDEAVEVYESCYNGKTTPHFYNLQSKLRARGTLFGRNNDRDSAVPCKAACCNIQ